MKTILLYILSFRPEQVLVTLSVLFFGVWASSHEATMQDYVVLSTLALAGHIFGYGINDLVDYRFDRLNPKHTHRISLVSQRFDRTLYLTFTLLQLPMILILGLTTYGITPAIGWVVAALISITGYNLLSKRSGRMVLAVHLLFPMALVLLCIGGYCLFDPFTAIDIPFVLFLVTLFVISFLANSFIGGILDLQSDHLAGATTLAIALGCRWDGHRVYTSGVITNLTISIFWIIVLLISAQVLINQVPLWTYPLFAVLIFYAGAHLHAYLKLEDPGLLRSYDAIASPSLLFYAVTLAWIDRLPAIWWAVIAFFLVYPLLVRREDRFGLPTLKALFAQRNT